MPDRRLTDESFLEKFVGVYDLQKTPVTVALKDEKTLTATIQGQPEYVLVPYQGAEFNLQGLSGFSIEFKQDENGQCTHAIVTQPGMVFIANRRE
jgi:hypothetical protein